jgi:hypothetical protein
MRLGPQNCPAHCGRISVILLILLICGSSARSQGTVITRCGREGTTNKEISQSVECVMRSIDSIDYSYSKRIAKLEDELRTLDSIILYGTIHSGTILSSVKRKWCAAVNVTVERERPGLFIVTLDPPLNRAPVVIITPIANDLRMTGSGYEAISALSERGFRVETSPDGKILNDMDFDFLVLSGDPNSGQCIAGK